MCAERQEMGLKKCGDVSDRFSDLFSKARKHEAHIVTETLDFWGWKVPNSRFALHGFAPP